MFRHILKILHLNFTWLFFIPILGQLPRSFVNQPLTCQNKRPNKLWLSFLYATLIIIQKVSLKNRNRIERECEWTKLMSGEGSVSRESPGAWWMIIWPPRLQEESLSVHRTPTTCVHIDTGTLCLCCVPVNIMLTLVLSDMPDKNK